MPSEASIEPVSSLVMRAQAGDRSAEGELCSRFRGAVYAFARRRLRTREAVEELVQDVFLSLVEALRRGAVSEPDRVGGFVLGICRNVSHDRARQRERRRVLWDVYGAALAPLARDESETPSYDLMKLEDCLAQLSQRARDVVRFSYVEMLSHVEVAARLAISEANARVLRHRTLQALRQCAAQEMVWVTR